MVLVVVTILVLCIELFGRMMVCMLVPSSILRLLGKGKKVLEVVMSLCICLLFVCVIVNWVELIWPIRFTFILIVVLFCVSRTVPDPIECMVC